MIDLIIWDDISGPPSTYSRFPDRDAVVIEEGERVFTALWDSELDRLLRLLAQIRRGREDVE